MAADVFVANVLTPIASLIFNVMSNLFSLYTTHIVLTAFLALWVFRKIVNIFELIKP